MTADELRALLALKISTDKRIAALLKKIAAGRGSFRDTMSYALISGELTGEQLAEVVLELTDDREELVRLLVHDRWEGINEQCAAVQTAFDEHNALHLAPQKAAFPAERVMQIAHSLSDPTVSDDTIRRRARSVSNVVASLHDDFIEANAKFRSKAGLECYIERITDGTCCAWCTAMAGRDLYDIDTPQDVFRRHDNCTCNVFYVSEKGRQNVHTKEWVDSAERAERIKYAENQKPRRLSREQGQKLQADNAPKRLTGGGESGIIQERTIAASSFLNSSDQLYENAKHIKPLADYQDIVIHGDKTGFSFRDKDGNESYVNVKEFADILKASGLYKGGKIRLISCEAAAEGAQTAQWLADELDATILAPTDIVWVARNGTMTIGPDEFTDSGKWVKVEPRKR